MKSKVCLSIAVICMPLMVKHLVNGVSLKTPYVCVLSILKTEFHLFLICSVLRYTKIGVYKPHKLNLANTQEFQNHPMYGQLQHRRLQTRLILMLILQIKRELIVATSQKQFSKSELRVEGIMPIHQHRFLLIRQMTRLILHFGKKI